MWIGLFVHLYIQKNIWNTHTEIVLQVILFFQNLTEDLAKCEAILLHDSRFSGVKEVKQRLETLKLTIKTSLLSKEMGKIDFTDMKTGDSPRHVSIGGN